MPVYSASTFTSTFALQVLAAQGLGYSAVIVHNNESGGDKREQMNGGKGWLHKILMFEIFDVRF